MSATCRLKMPHQMFLQRSKDCGVGLLQLTHEALQCYFGLLHMTVCELTSTDCFSCDAHAFLSHSGIYGEEHGIPDEDHREVWTGG